MSNKTEKASAYKLQKAKEKGQVSKSVELTTCVLMLVLLGIISALWPASLQQIKALSKYLLFLSTKMNFSVDCLCQLQGFIGAQLVTLGLPLVLATLITIILTTIAQTGFV